jgi:hypothetical protein
MSLVQIQAFCYPLNAKKCFYRKGSMVEVKVDLSIDIKKIINTLFLQQMLIPQKLQLFLIQIFVK